MYWLWILPLLCLNAKAQDEEIFFDAENEPDVHSRRAIQCETRDNSPGYCLPLARCRRIMSSIRRYRNPNICFFERELPYVCCPVRFRTHPESTTSKPRHVRTTRHTRTTTRSRPVRTTTRRRHTTTRRPHTTPTPHRITTPRQPHIGRLTNIKINPKGCGKRVFVPSHGSAFVVGGKEAQKNSWPWMAGIRIKTYGQNTAFLCGGSLITQRHILSAAHCFNSRDGPRPPSDYTVILGSHYKDIKTAENAEEILTVSVIRITVHEEYKERVHDYDVAVMFLDTDIPTSDHINPVCLPSRPNHRDVGDVTVLGWGDLSFGGEGSNTLQEASFEVVPLSRCRQIFRQIPSLVNGITSRMLCAGDIEKEKDSCQNDSGGPLLEENEDENKWTQVGIVSFGFRCAEKGFPGVYSRVASFIPWIQHTIRSVP